VIAINFKFDSDTHTGILKLKVNHSMSKLKTNIIKSTNSKSLPIYRN